MKFASSASTKDNGNEGGVTLSLEKKLLESHFGKDFQISIDATNTQMDRIKNDLGGKTIGDKKKLKEINENFEYRKKIILNNREKLFEK